jgi:hypothetical protein
MDPLLAAVSNHDVASVYYFLVKNKSHDGVCKFAQTCCQILEIDRDG